MKKVFYFGIGFLLTGFIGFFIENTFYDYVDEKGLLHESLFLPLGFILGISGIAISLVYFLTIIVRSIKKS